MNPRLPLLALAGLLSVSTVAVGQAGKRGDWSHEVKTDPADGAVMCTVQKLGSEPPFPWFFYRSGSGVSVAVVGEMSLGDVQTFRVDEQAPITESDRLTGARARALIAQVRAGGKTLQADYVSWPSGKAGSLKVNLDGVIDHLDACKAAMVRTAKP